jgi:outer membrane murein-binding lipoprotein Lpp
MKHFWKWLGLAACGVGLLVASERLHVVTASENGPAYERDGDLGAKIDRLADKLDQMSGRMGRGGPPGGPRGGMPPEMRERLEQARGAMQERMEKARERFQQLEDRVQSLEAEVERLKTSPQS